MPNKISGYSPTSASTLAGAGGSQAAEKAALGAAGAPSAAPAATATDTATFTGPARTLQKLNEVVANTPVVNTEKVSAVKEAIQNGSYRIDATSVANKLLQYDSELS